MQAAAKAQELTLPSLCPSASHPPAAGTPAQWIPSAATASTAKGCVWFRTRRLEGCPFFSGSCC